MKNSKVLVGCPTSDYHAYCLDEYAQVIKNLTYDNYNVLLVDNSKDENYFKKIKSKGLKVIRGKYLGGARDRIIASRNMLREIALKKGYDYLLSLEQDVIPPKDIIERMLGHNKKIICGVYFAHNVMLDNSIKLIPLVYTLTDKKTLTMNPLDESALWSNKLLRVISCGMGCVLIHKDVLKEITFRYNKTTRAHDDRWFCIDAYYKKFEMFCDTSIKCKHLIENRPWKWKDLQY